MSSAKKNKVGRPPTQTNEQRRAKAAARMKAWREAHPFSWSKIWKRSYDKRKAQRKAAGVEVNLNLSDLGVIQK